MLLSKMSYGNDVWHSSTAWLQCTPVQLTVLVLSTVWLLVNMGMVLSFSLFEIQEGLHNLFSQVGKLKYCKLIPQHNKDSNIG